MDMDDNPVFGISQPSNGVDYKLRLSVMGRRHKTQTKADAVRKNIAARLNVMFPNDTDTEQYRKLQSLCGVGAETTRKFMKGLSSMTLRKLEAIADAISLTMVQLFTDPEPARKPGPSPNDDPGEDILQRR